MRAFDRILRNRNSTQTENVAESLYLPLTSSIVPSKGNVTPSFTRATTATTADFEGIIRTAKSGEVRFGGARRVENLITGSNTDTCAISGNISNSIAGLGTVVETLNYTTNPLGATTATRLQLNLNGGTTSSDRAWKIVTNAVSATAGVYNVSSIWIKANTGTPAIQLRCGGNVATITLTNSWKRYSIIKDNSTDTTCAFGLRGAGGTSDSADISVAMWMVENVTGQANQNPSEYVSNGATRTNLFRYTEVLTNSVWGGNALTVQEDVHISPFGGVTADKLIPSISSSAHYLTNTGTNPSAITSDYITISGYFKAEGYSRLGIREQSVTGGQAAFDLSNGTIIGTNNGTATNVSASISTSNNGYYRISVTIYKPSSPFQGIRFNVLDNNYTDVSSNMNVYTWTPNGTSGIYATGLQFESSQSVTSYQKITDASPADFNFYYYDANVDGVKYFNTYNGNTVSNNAVTENTGSGIPLALLKGYQTEVASTNLCLRSEEFDNASWTKNESSVSTNAASSPTGQVLADGIIASVNNVSSHGVNTASAITVTNGTSITTSVYAKKGAYNYFCIGAAGSYNYANYNLLDGTISGVGAGVSASIIPIMDGWYRCTYTVTSLSTSYTPQFYINSASGSTPTAFAGDGISIGTYLWGAQVEQLPMATSYIPTTSATVTRNADVLTYPNTGVVSDTAGTISMEATPAFDIPNSAVTGYGVNYLIDFGSNNGSIWVKQQTIHRYDGTTEPSTPVWSPIKNTTYKISSRYGSTGQRNFLDGTAGTIGSFDGSINSGANMSIGKFGGGLVSAWGGWIKNVKIRRKSLTDSKIIQLQNS